MKRKPSQFRTQFLTLLGVSCRIKSCCLTQTRNSVGEAAIGGRDRKRELSAWFLKARSLIQILGRKKVILNVDKLLCVS